ncbi:MAG: hypothetical protein GY941_30375, partial [Planctomycetes bacterium]|nr:hypothetical protein [Planctomycetota bacterium]
MINNYQKWSQYGLCDTGATLNTITRQLAEEWARRSDFITIEKSCAFPVENGGGKDIRFNGDYIRVYSCRPDRRRTDVEMIRNCIETKIYITPYDKISFPLIIGRPTLNRLHWLTLFVDASEHRIYGEYLADTLDFDVPADSMLWEMIEGTDHKSIAEWNRMCDNKGEQARKYREYDGRPPAEPPPRSLLSQTKKIDRKSALDIIENNILLEKLDEKSLKKTSLKTNPIGTNPYAPKYSYLNNVNPSQYHTQPRIEDYRWLSLFVSNAKIRNEQVHLHKRRATNRAIKSLICDAKMRKDLVYSHFTDNSKATPIVISDEEDLIDYQRQRAFALNLKRQLLSETVRKLEDGSYSDQSPDLIESKCSQYTFCQAISTNVRDAIIQYQQIHNKRLTGKNLKTPNIRRAHRSFNIEQVPNDDILDTLCSRNDEPARESPQIHFTQTNSNIVPAK